MITHSFKYGLLNLMRNRSELFWILAFPIILSTLFKIGFSNITSKENYDVIPVAVVCEENDSDKAFRTVMDELSEEGDDQLLTVTYCDDDTAMELLENKKIVGIISYDEAASLTVSSEMKNQKINQSILQYFVEQYNLNSKAITDIATNHPEKLMNAITAMSEEITYNREVSLSKTNVDTYTQYYYNLLAMACLFTAMSGMYVSLHNQGNLSALGARKNVSPMHKMISIIGELLAHTIFNFIANLIAFAYIVLVLKIDLTIHLPLAILTLFIGCMTGVFFGFFVGAIGRMSEGTKIGIILGVDMTLCFLSGLMVGSMRIIVDMVFPIFNRINPAALIADSFYSLATFDSFTRYTQNILTLLLFVAFFCIGGFLLTRRKKYASL